jgi:hypothetical protein
VDFIERLFGISPDGGNGLWEAVLFLIPVVAFALFYARSRFTGLPANTSRSILVPTGWGGRVSKKS